MNFLVDECVGRQVFNWFKANNYDVLFVKDECEGVSDDVVLEKSRRDGRVLITCDKDFGDMIFRDQKKHVGIVLLRLIDESPKNKIRVLNWLLENNKDIIDNNFLLVSDRNVRIVQVR